MRMSSLSKEITPKHDPISFGGTRSNLRLARTSVGFEKHPVHAPVFELGVSWEKLMKADISSAIVVEREDSKIDAAQRSMLSSANLSAPD